MSPFSFGSYHSLANIMEINTVWRKEALKSLLYSFSFLLPCASLTMCELQKNVSRYQRKSLFSVLYGFSPCERKLSFLSPKNTWNCYWLFTIVFLFLLFFSQKNRKSFFQIFLKNISRKSEWAFLMCHWYQ